MAEPLAAAIGDRVDGNATFRAVHVNVMPSRMGFHLRLTGSDSEVVFNNMI
jgi:hypothetical protein